MITYVATNTLNGKFYIGSTVNFKNRKKAHLRGKEKYPFQNALRKNPEAFVWHTSEDSLNEPKFEQTLLDMYFGTELCYNLNPKADRPPVLDQRGEKSPLYGKHLSEEHRQKISRATSGEKNPNYGKKASTETRKKQSDAHKGEKHPFFGKKRPDISERMAGERNPMYGTSGELSPRFGQTHTEESKQKLRESKLGERNPGFGKTGELSARSKKVEVTHPSGEVVIFVSATSAYESLGCDPSSLKRWAKGNQTARRGKWAGFKFRYLE
jgi:group I intron endonuclease